MVEIIVPVVAFGVIGAVSGVLLTVASKVFEVKTDERLEAIQEALPQINCGSCGFSGCNDYADAVLGGAACNLCKPGGSECANKLGEIMGIGNVEIEEKVAFVKCKGGCDVASHKYTYDGSQSCKAANRFYNGSKLCTNGCLGFGDCVDACQENGICIVDGVAVVNGDKCVACGMCIKACPNNLIVLRPKSQRIDVACSSTAMGKVTRTVCKTGCIGCKLCEKRCPSEAIKIVNNVAVIDYSKCTNCGLCEESCKVGAIVSI